MQFTELTLCKPLQEGLEAMNFTDMTPVQERAIPAILAKKDVIACAQTGTGKTAAFLLPLLNNLLSEPHEENKVNAIIMAPTRELAQQIDQQMEGFSYYTPFSSVAVYGGNNAEAWDVQKRGLMNGADVVIATPGRLLSHINLYNIDFSGVKYFILDEADRMLDLGFFDDIMKIANLLPKDRQTVMFSATMPPKIQQLAITILHNPEEITIAISRPPDSILQSAYICYDTQKINILKHLFKEKKPKKVILFSGSKQKVKEIARTLHKMGLSTGEMHSDLDQVQRNHVMHEFKNERVDILVATDIVSRGIDIDDITLVINYDVPYDAEDYVHRIGRTARAGDTGMAITFVSPEEQYRFSLIEKFLQKEIYRIPIPAELGEGPSYNPSRESAQRGKSGHKLKQGKGSKGGKRQGGSDKSQKVEVTTADAEKATKQEKQEKQERKKRPPRQENKERLENKVGNETLNKSESSLPANEGDKPRLEEKQRPKNGNRRKKKPRRREDIGIQSQRREDSELSTPQRENGERPKKKVIKKSERLQLDATKQPSEANTAQSEKNPRTRNKYSRTRGDKRAVVDEKEKKQSTEVQTSPVEPEKKKRWSWWPFGKK
jgi:ATP-dependent RNA helicase RhlE